MDSCHWLQVWDSNPRLQGYEPCELAAVLTCQRAAELKGKMPGCVKGMFVEHIEVGEGARGKSN